jgi:hypothetical protein
MRALRAWLALAVYLLAGAHAAAAVLTLRAFGMTVSDIGRPERFYRDTLGSRPFRASTSMIRRWQRCSACRPRRWTY